MKATRIRFPNVVKRGSSVVKIYRDRKQTGTYYRVGATAENRTILGLTVAHAFEILRLRQVR